MIKKAVIPAAGLGTRVLPASKTVPKEMLNIVDKPAIHYIVEEAVKAGITDILIITNRGKEAIEDYFDHSYELEDKLLKSGKTDALSEVENIPSLANIYFLRQKQTKGLGDAVLRAKEFVGNDPFAVLYGDDVIIGEVPAIGELIDAYEKHGKCVVGIKEVSKSQILKYSSLEVSPLSSTEYTVSDMIEKPDEEHILSLFSILGRCVLTSEIFDILQNTPLGAGGELQLTDAMKQIAKTKGMIGIDFSGKRYDMGNKLGMLKASVEVGLNHPEIGKEFTDYIKELAKTLK